MPDGIVTTRVGPVFSRGAELLVAYLARPGKSQNALALELGTTSPVVNRWIHGDRRPALKFAVMLATKLRIPTKAWNEPASRGFRLKSTQQTSG